LGKKRFFFSSGILVSVPVTFFISRLVDSFCLLLPMLFGTICAISVVAPVVEEFAKAYPFFYRYGISSRPLMTLGFFAGLGFGIAEFFVYVFIYQAPLILRIHPIFFHAASTSIVAHGISKRSTLKFYLSAVVLHSLNNLFASLDFLWLIGGLGVTMATYYLSYRYFRSTRHI